MKYFYMIFLFFWSLIILNPAAVFAQRGCCSHHGGVAGCNADGRQICNDGTLSPSCTCTPTITYVYGCTDPSAKNYNSNANRSDGSCQYYTYGCTDKNAINYSFSAEKDDGSCQYYVYGCTDENANNFNPLAEKDDNSCEYALLGCTDSLAKNYDAEAQEDDGSCEYYIYGCTDPKANNYNAFAERSDSSCEYDEGVSSDSDILYVLVPALSAAGVYYLVKRKKS